MTRNDLLKRVRQRPFVPFRMIVSENANYDVLHPDQIIVARDHVSVGLPMHPEQDFYETTVVVDLLQVVRLEPISAAAPATGDGAGA
jgi:hypothetical protein